MRSSAKLAPAVSTEFGRVEAQVVSGNYFRTLGVNTVLGRLLTPEDDRGGNSVPVAVISYKFWQRAFQAEHGLQCGFCTPGFVVSVTALLADNPDPSDDEIRDGLSGNLCRCTGYQGIVRAVRRAAIELRDTTGQPR